MERTQTSATGSQREKDILLNVAEQWRIYHLLPQSYRLPLEEFQEAVQHGLENEGIIPGQSDRLNMLAELEAITWDW